MHRKLVSVLAALLLSAAGLIGITVATSGPASASVIPANGSYSGVDHGGRLVSLTFHGNQVTHLMVGSQSFGGAHVSNGMWHETCHGGWCTKGQWVTDKHIQGFWRHGGSSHWTAFSVSTSVITPYVGSYMGRDHSGLSVKFGYAHGSVNHVHIDHNLIGSGPVSGNAFHVCTHTVCFRGHWQSDYTVSGTWRYVNESHWRAFEAQAYATSSRAL
ncbi:hypothetical protein [Nocardioides mangrovi]|uniref:Uncharacterized protein n=1 Tax=Nocardioides mangrovi TaxID=2874580 RepID=A0ABS7UBD5_9ACTN|nr:hypothetical protein [Nocardioides mangrovi]MBZ5738036.1 hypothetical protein [Nocardioides mangrovi]